MAYNKEKDKDRDYQAEINQAVANNDFATASALEKDRNEKIDAEGLDASLKTDNYNIPTGMTGATYNAINTPYSQDDASKETQKETEKYLGNLTSLTDKNSLLNPSVWSDLDESFRTPSAVAEADRYLASQLEKIQSGKTSYSDQVSSMLDKIMNREKFSYDVDNDPLFQQALASSMNAGKTAMQDTIGQASALTGGYGSTYATTAGNQAYNSFIEDAYDNLPQYYQMALDAYNMEGEEMYRQFGALSDMDNNEYNRMLTSFDATNQYRNNLYNEAYTQFRDTKTDALNKANLQLSEHGQLVSDAYNAYSAMSDYSKTLYERSYNEWADKVNLAIQMGGMEMDSYWNQTNFDEGVRRYEKDFAETQRVNNANLELDQQRLNEQIRANKASESISWANLNYKKQQDAKAEKKEEGSKNEKVVKATLEKTEKLAKMNDVDKIYEAVNNSGLKGAEYANTMTEALLYVDTNKIPWDRRCYKKIDDTVAPWVGLGDMFNADDPDDLVVDNFGHILRVEDIGDAQVRADLSWIDEGEYVEYRTEAQIKNDWNSGLTEEGWHNKKAK